MNKKRRRAKLVPRLGPPQNLRPAGAHESKKHYNRKRHKAALAQYDEDGFTLTGTPPSVAARPLRANPAGHPILLLSY